MCRSYSRINRVSTEAVDVAAVTMPIVCALSSSTKTIACHPLGNGARYSRRIHHVLTVAAEGWNEPEMAAVPGGSEAAEEVGHFGVLVTIDDVQTLTLQRRR